MRVLDLGGTGQAWRAAPVKPAQLVVLNQEAGELGELTGAELVVGDVCELPASLQGERFDLVYSNSVIEHVGGHAKRLAMADVVHRMGDHHWIQTPYRYFPIEPHWLFPGMQFLPAALRVRVARRWRLSWARPKSWEGVDNVLWIQLLSRTEMRHYFPESELVDEKIMFVTKSLIAAR